MKLIAHVDMDCFFAACEIKQKPELKDKPIVIGALAKRGVVSTANYVARKYGIKSAMPVSKAYALCPKAIFIKPNMQLYQKESNDVMQILKMFCTNFEQVSVDEAYLDITDFAEECFNLEEAGNKIKQMVFEETKLTCSIGISTSRYVSKIASDFNKPNGVTVVENNKEFLQDLPISKISGIGKVTASNLENIGIKTIADFANAEYFKLNDIFGDWIINIQKIARGEDKTGVYNNYEQQKSISRETTFEEDITLKECFNEIDDMAEEIFEDMCNYSFKKVSIKIRYSDFRTITREISLKVPQKDKETICIKGKELLNNITPGKIRLFGIKINDLKYEEEKQTDLETFLCTL